MDKRYGFSLVELSIVLVILGLLTGGILTGQSLIRAAELRSITSDYQQFTTATMAFRDRYLSLPGDCSNATQFWKTSPACSGAAADGVCDGNDNGRIEYLVIGGASQPSEAMQFWRHLAKAGLLEGSYGGTGADLTAADCGTTNCPASKVSNAYWAVRYWTASSTTTGFDLPDDQPGNHFIMGRRDSNGWPQGYTLRPEEAWNIDMKADDGKPAYGKIIALHWPTCTKANAATELAAAYNLNNTTITCSLYFKW